MRNLLLVFCLFAAIAANAKEEPIRLFPRTYGYFTKGDSDTRTITYDHAYGQYGWKNSGNVELSAYNYIILEIEPTDSRVEVHILYEGDEKGVCIGKIEGGKTKAVCEFDGARKVQAIYLAKSKIGIARIIRFALTDKADSLQE
ncbi:hypothetical protein [uncultured Bacteroides sp.]|uniref:hypothetical protein n=1 Tax=uncultured Bacteroides sp. TaxID=162156 RepID=UPI0025F7266A|nr:hypothetical protein [uncultured Bacteroides sp.]